MRLIESDHCIGALKLMLTQRLHGRVICNDVFPDGGSSSSSSSSRCPLMVVSSRPAISLSRPDGVSSSAPYNHLNPNSKHNRGS